MPQTKSITYEYFYTTIGLWKLSFKRAIGSIAYFGNLEAIYKGNILFRGGGGGYTIDFRC